MADRRRQVFVEKVLKRLFPNVPSGQAKGTPQTVASETPPQEEASEKGKQKCGHRLTDGSSRIQPERRLYTVSLPPEGYVPCLPDPSSRTNSENTSSAEDAEDEELGERKADQDLHDQPKRRRIRKHKSKKKFKNFNSVHIEQAELEKPQSLFQEKSQPSHTDGPAMSKNKRRKLKKKQQLRRKRAAGSAAKPAGVSFTYQPEESSSELEEERGAARADLDPREADSSGEDEEATDRKADRVLSFLKSTQEIYFYDGVSKDPDPAVCVEATGELLTCLESRSMPPSDVFILDHMRRLLLLHDTERLRRALEMFPDHCTMPPEHARIISSFFNYWITHILPDKDSE